MVSADLAGISRALEEISSNQNKLSGRVSDLERVIAQELGDGNREGALTKRFDKVEQGIEDVKQMLIGSERFSGLRDKINRHEDTIKEWKEEIEKIPNHDETLRRWGQHLSWMWTVILGILITAIANLLGLGK